jgi:hypothetical protein
MCPHDWQVPILNDHRTPVDQRFRKLIQVEGLEGKKGAR